jgi:hypothetical protein
MDHPIHILNTSNTSCPTLRAKYCASFFCRLRGLMFNRHVKPGEGLLLVEKKDSKIDSSIHMMFMLTDLAVVWINDQHIVVDVILAKKWAPAYFPKQPARYTLELHPNHLNDFKVGDQLEFKNV